ncbi:hypothetical protein NHH03_03720 [Stieleria sp. TO1_6]|uniref:hypothetical protein n=1 Tax=Stieleria tagensis TaxID=2956795 RepID=UPI00209B20D4|nr:hypothetical protein [Stieleria tagensis]MCO8120833.1 hypothetical protein [Stieleria tagensis]
MRFIFLAAAQLLMSLPLIADEPNPFSEFKSLAAKNAIKKYSEKLAFLDEKLAEQVRLADTELRADFRLALKEAVQLNDFPEVERLSKFLQTLDTNQKDEKQSFKKPDSVVQPSILGTWKFPDGNILEMLEDGRATLRGRTVAIWRPLANGTFVIAYVNSFPRGFAYELKLQESGNLISGIGHSGKPFEIPRIANP